LKNQTEASIQFLHPYEAINTHGRYLPHWEQGEATHFVTWRMGDSLPQEKIKQWATEKEAWLKKHPRPWNEETTTQYHTIFSDRLDAWLDRGLGSCILRDKTNRDILKGTIRHFDMERYTLYAFVIMPNHAHVLFSLNPPHELSRVIHSWKSFSAKQLNKKMGKSGKVWQENYWDRLIRSEAHFVACIDYIRDNPEKAKLGEKEFSLWVSGQCEENEQ
jgi:REP element-mobilizing transposase RayT